MLEELFGAGRFEKVVVQDSIILAGNSSSVGGLSGQTSGGYGGYCVNTIIEGKEDVGGIIGYMPNGTFYISYVNAHITATDGPAGGLVGYLDNANMNIATATGVSKIYRNLVASSSITGNKAHGSKGEVNLAGSLIGKISAELLVSEDATYYHRNFSVSNVDKYIGGLVLPNDVTNVTYTFPNTKKYRANIEVGQDSNNDKIIDEEIEKVKDNIVNDYRTTTTTTENKRDIINYTKSIRFNATINYKEQEDQTKLNLNVFKKILQNSWSPYDCEGYYPYLNIQISIGDGDPLAYKTKVELPTDISNNGEENQIPLMSMFSLNRSVFPTYDIYVSDVNKINIEFSDISNNSYFRYEANNNTSKNKLIDNRVYTLEYDFITPIKLIIGNGKREEEVIINPEDISKKISIVNNSYYYLQDNTLNKTFDVLEGEYVNIYNKKALTIDGYIYDLDTNTKTTKKTEGIKLLEESKPISEYTYSGKIIETYYNFSKVISDKAENLTEYQIFIKNGKIVPLDGDLDIYGDSIIIDSYNNKEYQTALGKDGIIYDFKEKINYPEEFENKNIIQMTNNFTNNTSEILIMYDDGRVYVFNYITGNVLFDTDTTEKTLLNTVSGMLRSVFSMRRTALYLPETEEYEESVKLQEKLTDMPVEEAIDKIKEKTNDNFITNTVITNAIEDKTEHTIKNNEVVNNVSSDNNINNNVSQKTENSNNKTDINTTITSNESTTTTVPTEDTKVEESYVTVYDSDTNKYLVYKTSDILGGTGTKTEKIVSETEKIEKNQELKEYYETANGKSGTRKTNGIYLIVISISAIGIILIIMYKKKNYA